ncbi:aspartate aminotransferase [Gemmatimonadetes bacterium T265]|nr:aspartate aminotransferase [Gemmatimonadetes bacterium T265]
MTVADRPAPPDSAAHAGSQPFPPAVSQMAAALVGSEILKIAAEIRAMRAAGATVCNLTVGDFDPAQFRIPRPLEEFIVDALRAGETNYPPSAGIDPLRAAVSGFWQRRLNLDYPAGSVLITGGSRPGIYGTYRTLVDAGDKVVYPVPSWNNNHYVHLVDAVGVPLVCGPESGFLPTADALAPLVRDPAVRLVAVNSPLNPAGTCFTADQLEALCDVILAENRRRGAHERPLYLLYDQVYWTLTFGTTRHVDPVSLRPAMRDYTVYVDGISKAFAATGVRVGWVAGPERVVRAMSDVLGHVGAWAPRAEQAATARFIADDAAVDAYQGAFIAGVRARLDALHDGFVALRNRNLPVEAFAPAGAIYLSVRLNVLGRRTPDGQALDTNEAIRRWLLDAAGLALVPFQAFGTRTEDGWFRASVGATSVEEIAAVMPRAREALGALA